MILDLVDGVLDLVRAGLPYLKKVEDLPGVNVLAARLDTLMTGAPAVYGIYEGGRFGTPLATAFRQPVASSVILAVFCKSLRDASGRAASRGDEGAYRVLDDLRLALLGKEPAPGFGPLEQAAEGLYTVKSGGVVYLATYRASYQLTAF